MHTRRVGTGIVSIDIMGFMEKGDYDYLSSILSHNSATMGKVDLEKFMRGKRFIPSLGAASLATMPANLPGDLRNPAAYSQVSVHIMHEPAVTGDPPLYSFSLTVGSVKED